MKERGACGPVLWSFLVVGYLDKYSLHSAKIPSALFMHRVMIKRVSGPSLPKAILRRGPSVIQSLGACQPSKRVGWGEK